MEASKNLISHDILHSLNQALETQLKSISRVWRLYARGSSIIEIASKTGLTEEEISEILESD